MRILMHFSLFNSNWFLMIFFFDDAIHRQARLFTSFQTVKVDRFVERKVDRKKTTICLSYLISSHSPWSFKCVKINWSSWKAIIVLISWSIKITQPRAWRNYQTPLLLLSGVITLIVDTWYSVFDVIAVSFDWLSVKLLHWAPLTD